MAHAPSIAPLVPRIPSTKLWLVPDWTPWQASKQVNKPPQPENCSVPIRAASAASSTSTIHPTCLAQSSLFWASLPSTWPEPYPWPVCPRTVSRSCTIRHTDTHLPWCSPTHERSQTSPQLPSLADHPNHAVFCYAYIFPRLGGGLITGSYRTASTAPSWMRRTCPHSSVSCGGPCSPTTCPPASRRWWLLLPTPSSALSGAGALARFGRLFRRGWEGCISAVACSELVPFRARARAAKRKDLQSS